jgi:transposase
LPLSYEVFEGNRADVTTLEEILDSVERKHGKLGRVWVFDRGIVSEENLNLLRSRGASYLVATPKRLLTQFQKDLIAEDWTQVANHPQIQVKCIERNGELYVLTRSLARAEKERAMRQRVLKGLRKDLAKLSKAVRRRTGSPAGAHLHTAWTTRGTLALGVVLPQRGYSH